MYKKNAFVHILIIILMMLVLSGFTLTYAFFDRLSDQRQGIIDIGEWIDLSAPATPEIIQEVIDNTDTSVVTNCDCQYIDSEYVNDFLEDILFVLDDSDELILNPLFEDYTVKEMIDTINFIRKFIANFLVLDENNNFVYPEPEMVAPMELEYDWGLLSGDSNQVLGFLVLANLSGVGTNKPVTIIVSMENANPDQEDDLSDFACELLIDQTPLALNNPFPYGMTLRDREAWNDPILKNNIKNYGQLLSINEQVVFSTYAYKEVSNGNYQLKEYLHQYNRPSYHGDFRRFPQGLNYYLGKPQNSQNGIQQIFEKDNKNREGFILTGKANGRKVEARVDLDDRSGGEQLVIIPFVIVLSRGIEVGSPTQKMEVIAPKIKIAVINGWVHEEYNHDSPGNSC